MSGFKVEDVSKGTLDGTGEEILTVYSKIAEVYAVYGTADCVMIQYADDPDLGLEQRRAMTPLNPLRGEIAGFVDGWRGSDDPKDKCRARLFDRRTADALTTALQGDQVHAEELLIAVRDAVLEERTSMGRVRYLWVASLMAVCVVVLFALVEALDPEGLATHGFASFVRENGLWLAAGVGCLGALFSIALGIRAREIRTDLQNRDNVADAILRVAIGAVSAVLLVSLLKSGLVTLGLGSTPIVEDGKIASHAAIVVAFLAGFSERLVSGYLTRLSNTAQGDEADTAKTSAAAQAAAQNEVEATERNPRGRDEVAIVNQAKSSAARDGAGSPATRGAAAHVHDEDDADGCACDIEVTGADMTEDDELPEATGGVAA